MVDDEPEHVVQRTRRTLLDVADWTLQEAYCTDESGAERLLTKNDVDVCGRSGTQNENRSARTAFGVATAVVLLLAAFVVAFLLWRGIDLKSGR